ncbi:threonine dehydrogenase-like Zn-dependent dehydrogenase [Breznakia blatticola]|uniref:Threonine dehydrogenase-like Zn-dependent dehydrogenase n=1 Tax=Breznakia blatticola TaxID=1754012 RepID=A0A4R8A4R9_9FIRM|nr:alcohol dehydrogenase catalytic domain-containing protein [Breznakia blatticola]TDW25515.1 threonine dehydrogenase-like Zn-dependent dehydrogenase [Breznakia blatticola]
MKALVLDKAYNYKVKDVELPILQDDEVLIEVKASGICTNDLRDYKGGSIYSLPRIGGHEYSGVIHSVGSKVNKKRFAIGKRAVAYIIPACGECYFCKRNEENLCEDVPSSKTFQNEGGISGFGGFAEYVAVKARDVYIYENEVPFEIMAMTEPLACVISSVNKCNVQFGDDVVIIGGGYMGLLHLLVAQRKGARVFLSEPDESRRKLAISYGCTAAFDPTKYDVVDEVKKLTDGRGAEVVFDTTSIAKVAQQAIEMTCPGGRCMLFSSIHPNTPIALDAGRVHSKEIEILGSVSPTVPTFNQAVLMLDKKIIDPEFLIHKVLPFTDVDLAFQEALKPDTFKVIMKFNS